MASFEDLPSGKVCAWIDLKGVRRSKTFVSKTQARAWATQEEALILAGARGAYPDRTLKEAFDRYERECSKGRRGISPDDRNAHVLTFYERHPGDQADPQAGGA